MTLYSTGCPKCRVLAKKLDEAGIKYDVVTGDDAVNAIIDHGFEAAPILEVYDHYLTFSDAIAMLKGNNDGSGECASCEVK